MDGVIVVMYCRLWDDDDDDNNRRYGNEHSGHQPRACDPLSKVGSLEVAAEVDWIGGCPGVISRSVIWVQC